MMKARKVGNPLLTINHTTIHACNHPTLEDYGLSKNVLDPPLWFHLFVQPSVILSHSVAGVMVFHASASKNNNDAV
jgi:hypothetical protein